MKRELFKELEASIKATGDHRRGKRRLVSTDPIPGDEIDVQKIREKLNLTQASFAALIRTSKRTVQDWEQGRRMPTGPARALLRVAEQRPDIVLQTLLK